MAILLSDLLKGGLAPLPVKDTNSIVEGSDDPTKEMRIEVDEVATATVRVATMPDKDLRWEDELFLRRYSIGRS